MYKPVGITDILPDQYYYYYQYLRSVLLLSNYQYWAAWNSNPALEYFGPPLAAGPIVCLAVQIGTSGNLVIVFFHFHFN